MVSTLASQLQQLREGGAGSKQKTASFLYDEREAARVDDETVYNVAWNGLLALQQLDARLDALLSGDEQVAGLFSRQRIHFHRAQVSRQEDAELDAALAKVLDALSGFFLLGATHKVLEFLVRRYEVHRCNVDAVMAVIISYHESKWFGRMVRLLHIRGTRWEFLLQAKQAGEPLLRAALVQRAHDEYSVLTFIFDAANRIGAANPKLISLYTMVTLEVLDRETPLREETLRWIIPQLLTALKATKVPELQSSAYMIVTKLASKSSLTEQVVSTIVKSLLKHAQPGGAQMNALLCVVFVIQSQSSFAFTKSTVKYLTQIDNVPDLIAEATTSYDSSRFLQLLTAFLAEQMSASDDDSCQFLVTLVESVPIAQETVEDLVMSLISIAQTEVFNSESNRVAAIRTVLAVLGKQHMTAVDSAVNSVLQNQRAESTDKKAKKAMSDFLTATFSNVANSAHFVPSNGNAATSLALALDHPTEHIRYQALVSLEKKYQNQNENSVAILDSGDVLLRRLQDDSERIVKFISTSSLGELLISLTPRKKVFSSIVQAVYKWAAKGAGSVTVLEAVLGFGSDNFRAKIASTDFDDRFVTLFIASATRGALSVNWARVATWIASLKTHAFSGASTRVIKLLDGESDESADDVVAGEFGKTLAENLQSLLPFCLRWSEVSEVNNSTLTPFLIQVLRAARSHAKLNDVITLDRALRAVAKKELRALYDTADRAGTNEYAVKTAQALCESTNFSLYTSSRSEFDACVATLLQSSAHLFILLQAELIGLFHDDLETELLPTLSRLATSPSNDVFEVLSKIRALDIICAALEGATYSTDKEINQIAHVIPVVLVSLGDLEQRVRQSAVACLERWLSSSSPVIGKKTAALKPLQILHTAGTFLLKAKQDIVMDNSAVAVRCAMYGAEVKAGSAAFYQQLMEFVSSASADELVIAVKLLDLLSSVKESSFWKQSLDFFEQTLAGYKGDNSTSTSLLTSLIAHYLDVDVAVLPTKTKNAATKVSKEFFDAMMAVLNFDGTRVSSLQTLQIFALAHLSRNYYEHLDSVAQYALVGRLLRLLMVAEEMVATKLIGCLNNLPIDSSIFVSLTADATDGSADLARLSCILEVLSIKVDSESTHAIVYENGEHSKHVLLNALGSVLSLFCAPGQEKSVTQYMLQILFQCLRRVCDNGSAIAEAEEASVTVSKRGKQAPYTADSEALVKNTLSCLSRESTSPATRNEALLFVSALVNLYPASVLESLEGVLGFVGTGSIRQEDEYTFHVLDTIIKSVVPHILKSTNVKISTQQFLGIFVSAFEQIPVTKRLALFDVLVTSLGPEQHLAYCVALLLQRAAVSADHSQVHEQFAHSLCLLFGCVVQISSTVKILRLARDLVPFVVDDSDTDTDDMDDDEDETELPSDPSYEPLAVADAVSQNKAAARKLNSLLVSFVSSHLQSRELHRMILAFQNASKMESVEEEEEEETDAGDSVLQHNYLMLAQVVLLYFRRVAHEQSGHDNDGFWAKLAASSMEILASLQQLLSTPGFVAVISELLRHENSLVRKKAMQLFNERLQNDRVSLSAGEELLFIDMLDELNTILQNKDGNENSMNIQTALLSVDILARNFAAEHTKRFQVILPTLVKYVNVDVARASTTVLHIMGCAFVALSSVCRAVGPIVFPLLPTFFPKLLTGIEYCSTTNAQAGSEDAVASSTIGGVKTVLQCLLTALEVFTEKIPQFLAPYLSTVIQTLLAPALVSTSMTNTSISMSVDCCLLNLTNHLELRQLLPSLFGAYDHALTLGDSSVEKLFSVVATVVGSLDSSSLRQYLPNFARFFVTALDVRRVHAAKLEDLEQAEDEVLECFVQFILKLSEKQLKPLFLKVSEWAQQPASGGRRRGANLDRRIAFSKLMVKLSERLRGIFVPYYAHVMEFLISGLVDSREVLTRKPSRRSAEEDAAASSDDDDDFFTRDETEQPPAKKSKLSSGESDAEADKKEREALSLLLHTTVRALDGCFVHDNDGFMEKERFEAVMTPLVNVFDVLKADRSDETRAFVFESVATTLANLAWAAKNDLLWKPMHYAVLMKSRGDVPAIRLAALKTVEKCYQVIGDEFLAMLPESIPFLAELMEDTDAEVERTCHEVIKQIEDISGESLDQYLTS